ncbi:MAG: hypothetical protein U0572_08180 [Phycisphaerales bacterium]
MSVVIRRRSYLNGILTVNACLLAALVWSNFAGGPSVAVALPQSSSQDANEGGVPNAGLQRLQTLNEIKALRSDFEKFAAAVTGGKLKVNVGNLSEIKLDIDYVRLKEAMKKDS